jgi:L-aspartate oxidase
VRVVVVGSGLAGLTAALEASRDHDVVLVTKAELRESNTRYAQGGVAAAIFPDDSVEAHVADTLAAGAGLCDREAVTVLCTEGPDRVHDLERLGVAFDRVDGALARGLEAAHSSARIVHVGGDATGAGIEDALAAAVLRADVSVREHHFMSELSAGPAGVTGVVLINRRGERVELEADAVVLASGGAGQLYSHTTNPTVATGDGVAAALRAGAVVADFEFYQFHPTSLAVPGNFLVSEAVRGEGAVLLDDEGERFMVGEHPLAELAPRDVVARGIAKRMQQQGGSPVRLDATALGRPYLEARFPSITRACDAIGLDWSRVPIPVTPAAHYWMGGVSTDLWGRTSIPGLFAVGEVARTGVHGANRLASNSLLEGLVFAHRAVRALGMPGLEPSQVQARRTLVPAPDAGTQRFTRRELQDLMWRYAGVDRDRDGLEAAASILSSWTAAAETVSDREDANLLVLAREVVAAALARDESRGAHFRSDHPETRLERAAG